jgi:hypothetical protein
VEGVAEGPAAASTVWEYLDLRNFPEGLSGRDGLVSKHIRGRLRSRIILPHSIVRGGLELVRGHSVAGAKSLPTCTMEELATVSPGSLKSTDCI